MSAYNVTPSPQPTCTCHLPMNTYIYINNVCVIVVNVLLAIFAVVCNAVVMLAVFKTNSLRRPSNLLICSLALSDFLVGAVAQPLVVVRLLLQNAGADCCLYNHLSNTAYITFYLFTGGSFVQVCVMSWDRYKAASKPLEYRATVTNRKTKIIIAATWSAWVIYVIIIQNLPTNSPLKKPLVILMIVAFIMIPVASQIAIQKALRRHNNQVAAAVSSAATFAREKKMLVTFRYILAVIFGSLLPPLALLLVVSTIVNNAVNIFLPPWVKTFICLSSFLNPLIYFWRHSDMRSAALKLIGR